MIIMSFNNKQPYKEKSYSENINDVQINKPEIQQIIIKHYGGRSLNDSIVYVINNKSFEFHVYSKNKEKLSSKVKELEEGIFLNLTKKLDLSDLKKITNGKSKYTKEEKENIRKNLEEKNQERKRTQRML